MGRVRGTPSNDPRDLGDHVDCHDEGLGSIRRTRLVVAEIPETPFGCGKLSEPQVRAFPWQAADDVLAVTPPQALRSDGRVEFLLGREVGAEAHRTRPGIFRGPIAAH